MTFELWRTLLLAYAHTGTWPEEQDLSDTPALVQELARAGLWLEQERLVLQPGLVDALTAVAHTPSTP